MIWSFLTKEQDRQLLKRNHTHMRTEFEEILSAMEEAFETGQYAKVPVVISHLKCAGAGNWGRTVEVLDLMDKVSEHQDVSCDCYPYSASSSTLDLKQVTDDFDIFITWSKAKPEHAFSKHNTDALSTF